MNTAKESENTVNLVLQKKKKKKPTRKAVLHILSLIAWNFADAASKIRQPQQQQGGNFTDWHAIQSHIAENLNFVWAKITPT